MGHWGVGKTTLMNDSNLSLLDDTNMRFDHVLFIVVLVVPKLVELHMVDCIPN